jgi:hypothetical protein
MGMKITGYLNKSMRIRRRNDRITGNSNRSRRMEVGKILVDKEGDNWYLIEVGELKEGK